VTRLRLKWSRLPDQLAAIHRLLVLVLLGLTPLIGFGCTSDPATSQTSTLAAPLPDIAPSPENSPTLNGIERRQELRVGVKFDVPLFGFQDPTTKLLSGFDIEIAYAIAADLFPKEKNPKLRVRFVEALSKNRESLLQNDQVDLVISTYTINDARKQLVDFAGPYYVAGQDILARRVDVESGVIQGVVDANGKKVCSVTGSTSLANLRASAPKADTSITKDKYSECFEALRRNEVDAMTTDDVILLGLAQGYPEFSLTGNPFHTEPYGIGVRKDDIEMVRQVNRVLQEMYDDGRWAEAFRRTVGTTEAIAPPPPELDATR
jgi:glutamate transport system substrate-binding protein